MARFKNFVAGFMLSRIVLCLCTVVARAGETEVNYLSDVLPEFYPSCGFIGQLLYKVNWFRML
ncbi:hypothetical protein KC19_6G188600 [Ceratodon purpureus]|uniref:Uncharacterized protein n=1 Tax=Ceratodon purpureus TaxID=3225 RepID=A0A8T0HJ41_CERPU|nr:hypothetical protein KC19_6G188600 [Ceratodon purpureus]